MRRGGDVGMEGRGRGGESRKERNGEALRSRESGGEKIDEV